MLTLHGAGPDRWDDHGDIRGRLPRHCREIDQPVAGLLKDLKARGLLEETLVVWASEMGRTPFDNNLVTSTPGRDHNQYGLCVWMAGGGVRPGATFGETDDFSVRAAGRKSRSATSTRRSCASWAWTSIASRSCTPAASNASPTSEAG